MAFDIKTARAVQTSGGFDIKTARPVTQKSSLMPKLAMMGPMGRGAVAAERGASFEDLPYLAAKTVSGVFAGGPEKILERPVAGFFQAKPSKVNFSGLFPKPVTGAGKKLGEDLENIAGLIDVAAVGGSAAKKIITPIKSAVNKAVSAAKTEIPANLPIVKRQVLKTVADRGKVLSNLQNVTRRTAQKEIYGTGETIRKEVDTLTQQLNQEVREAALSAQKALPKYFSKRSREYGQALDKILETAQSKYGAIPASDVAEAFGKTVQDLGIDYAGVRSPIENEIEALAMKYTKEAAEGRPVRFDELIGVKRRIESIVSAAKQSGSQPYSTGEHSLSAFRENIGGVLERYVDGLKDLNKNYAPFIKLKRQAVKVFKPFSGEFETAGAESFLKRSVMPRAKGTAQDAFLNQIESQIGSISGQARKTTEQISTAKEAARQQARSLAEAMQQRLIELEARKNKVGRGDVPERLLGLARKIGRYGAGRIL